MTDTWNNKTVERLIELNNLGYTCAEIAKALSLTRNAVIGKLYRLRKKQGKEKISSRNLSMPKKDKIVEPITDKLDNVAQAIIQPAPQNMNNNKALSDNPDSEPAPPHADTINFALNLNI